MTEILHIALFCSLLSSSKVVLPDRSEFPTTATDLNVKCVGEENVSSRLSEDKIKVF